MEGQREAQPRMNHLHGRRALGRDGSAKRLVPADNFVEASRELARVKRAFEPQRARDVVCRPARLHLFEEPEPLLREREGSPAAFLPARNASGVERFYLFVFEEVLEKLEVA